MRRRYESRRSSVGIKRQIVRAEFLVQGVVQSRRPIFCPHCKSSAHLQVGRKGGFIRILRCSVCGLCYTKPVYRSRLSPRFYDRMYTAEGSTTELPSEERLEWLKRSMFRGSDKDRSDTIERLRELSSSYPGRLLEFGSSCGSFFYQAQAAGFHVTGVDCRVSTPVES